MRNHVDLDRCGLEAPLRELLSLANTLIAHTLDVALEPLAKVLEHRGASGEDNVLVEAATRVDRGLLDGLIDDLRHRRGEIGIADLGVEEDLGAKEPLVCHVALPPRAAPLRLIELDPLAWILVVLAELLGHVGTHVAVLLLDALGDFHGIVGGDRRLALTQQQLDIVGDVAPGDRDVLDARADHVSFCHRNDVRHAIARVHHSAGQSALLDLLRGPRGSECKHRLNRNVQPLDVERLKHDLCGGLSVLGCVHRRLSEQKVVLIGVAAQVLENAALPVALHVVPVLDDAMSNWVVERVLV
mmetsp:Transcript_20957/g.53593  ORF Transcript_20957/g.53593 Transcript_20957/m.53593 type:complete len:300 (+) Transcript_20957:812-1711(+)